VTPRGFARGDAIAPHQRELASLPFACAFGSSITTRYCYPSARALGGRRWMRVPTPDRSATGDTRHLSREEPDATS
jgi:hypothetical protein